jgi:multicomponent Na+:H+ antiporter subunit C
VPPIALGEAGAPLAGAANPLPQALILTAIVIGFAMFAFLLVLAYRAYQSLEADDTDSMRVAEPRGGPKPPMSY